MTRVQYIRVFYGSVVIMTCCMIFLENNEEKLIDIGNDTTFRAPKIWLPLQNDDMNIIDEIVVTEISNEGTDESFSGSQQHENFNESFIDPMLIEGIPPGFKIPQTELTQEETKLKKILVWNSAYGSKALDVGFGHRVFKLAGCEENRCMMTPNRNLTAVQDFDAILFHFRGLTPKNLPHIRSPFQRWIFWEIESSSYVFQTPNKYNNMFNWTFTYKRNSDIVFTYGRMYKKEKDISNNILDREEDLTKIINGKTKMAAWFVSNCRTKSRRERFVAKLQKFMEVDIYGGCGPFKCDRSQQNDCYKMVERDYKFYFSFENSLCPDYVTEKFFNVLKYDVVPVVYGLGDYEAIAPPHSYINALHYPSEKDLAKYLLYLNHNETAYKEYFSWKTSYMIAGHWYNLAQSHCDLCKKLHNDKEPKVYKHMQKWFMENEKCMKPRTSTWVEKVQDFAFNLGFNV
ncbi:unnamed protein product [Meganyctiphanes norvegica]|uniref:Fucosyltransferase n=1 Tax=Meganyctiphanes norvegica TaxID=48144 RepID=A0AAV2Q9Y2_MEGNR